MIIYSVTYAVEDSIETEWLEHMRLTYLPNVMESGFFESYQFTRILPEQGVDTAYNVQFACYNNAKLDLYFKQLKDSHDQQLLQKFSGKMANFFIKLEKL